MTGRLPCHAPSQATVLAAVQPVTLSPRPAGRLTAPRPRYMHFASLSPRVVKPGLCYRFTTCALSSSLLKGHPGGRSQDRPRKPRSAPPPGSDPPGRSEANPSLARWGRSPEISRRPLTLPPAAEYPLLILGNNNRKTHSRLRRRGIGRGRAAFLSVY